MIAAVQPDARGVDALCPDLDANVALVQPLIFDELYEEMFAQLVEVDPEQILAEMVLDEKPWQDLPKIEELQYIWLTPDQLISKLAATATAGRFDTMSDFLARQWWLADMELELQKEAAGDTGTDDVGGSGETPPVASADPQRSGGDLPGGSENGDTVGEGGEDPQHQNVGTTPSVPRKRRARQAAGRGAVGDAADDTPAAS